MIGIVVALVSFVAVWLAVVVGNQFTPTVAGGAYDGKFALCPDTPNCVSSQARDPVHAIAPLSLSPGTSEAIRTRLLSAIARMPRMTVVKSDGNYLHVEARTAFFRFVDDMELLIEPEKGLVQVRSGSRIGVSDLGANRRRVEALRKELAKM